MKLLKTFFLFPLLLATPLQGKIVEATKFSDILPLIKVEKDTWFLVDLDNTFFEAKQALGHANWFYDLLQEKMNQGLSKEEAIKELYPLWVKVQKVCPVKPVEEEFNRNLQQFQNQGLTIMGLTHRQPMVAKSTLKQVKSLNFDFSKTAPSKKSFEIESTSPTLYKQGILFVGDFNKKSDIFLPFLDKISKAPKKVIFIDDKLKNVEELEAAFKKMNIDYLGIYYRAIEVAEPIYSRKIADFQLKLFNSILPNDIANKLLKEGI